MQHERVFVITHQAVNNLCITQSTQGCHDDSLSLTAGKDRRAMRTLQRTNFTIDWTDRLLIATINPRKTLNHTATHHIFLDFAE